MSMWRTSCVALALVGGACDDSKAPAPADAGGRDAASADAGVGSLDAGARDAGNFDAGLRDAGSFDAGTTHDAQVDAGPDCVPFVMPNDCVTPENSALPSELRCTGLYGDFDKRALACGVRTYAPAHALWSDGAVKVRYVSLPEGSTIDVSDPDNFVFPVGTKFWKEFNIPDGQGGTKLGETRLLSKLTERAWAYTSYVWNEAGDNAIQDNDGVTGLFGTTHDVPTRDQCAQCHQGRADFVLGWDAVLLGGGATGVTLDTLGALGAVSRDGGALPTSAVIPGNAVEQAALAYLHVNCGVSCHNESAKATAKVSGLYLQLEAGKLATVQETAAYTSALNKVPTPNVPPAITAPLSGAYFDIRPLDLERSLIVARMELRGTGQMPLIGSNVVDPTGVAAVSAWIEAMTTDAGYPDPAP